MKPPPPPPIPSPPRATGDILARALAGKVRDSYGEGSAVTLDLSEELGAPRGWIGTRNIALERALGAPGIPMGRITEISGWEAAGKSTVADQIIAEAQAQGGIGIMADTERSRSRTYMARLGVVPESTIWIGGRTTEELFGEMEVALRHLASLNAMAWYESLRRAGVKAEKPATYAYTLTDPGNPKVVIAKHQFCVWGRAQAGALLDWQRREKMAETGVRDTPSRDALRPVVIHVDGADPKKAASESAALMSEYESGRPSPQVQPADRPVVAVWDSVAATPTKQELEGQPEDVHVAAAAKVIRRNLRRMVQLIDDEALAIVLVNQRYEKLELGGPPSMRGRGTKSETYGGGGIKYHTTIRIELTKVGEIAPPGVKEGEWSPPMGQIVSIRVPKNKVESPFHEENFGLIFGRGADNAWALYHDFKDRGIIAVGGGWSKFTDPTIPGGSFHGWTGLSNLLAEDPSLWGRLKAIYAEGR